MQIVDKIIRVTTGWEPTTLLPVGDLQLGSSTSDEKHYRRHLEWGMTQPNPWWLGTGDYTDFLSPSNRQRLRAAGLYDDAELVIDRGAEKLVDEFVHLSRGTKGRWLGMVHGHHYYEFGDGSTTDTRIAGELDAPYLGTTALILLRFKDGKRSRICKIFVAHGHGGGKTAGAPFNTIDDMRRIINADIYVMGHTTRKGCIPMDYLDVSERPPYKLIHRTQMLVSAGGFSQGYKQDSTFRGRPHGSYVEQGLMTPISLGGPAITIRPTDDRLDIHGSA